MLDWIVWNRTVYLYKNGFGIKQPTKLIYRNPAKKNKTSKQTDKQLLCQSKNGTL